MGDFIYFTDDQKERANAVPIADILGREGEQIGRSGNEWYWMRHDSVKFRGSSWYQHSRKVGGHAISFMQEFFGMEYAEAVTYLLHGEQGEVIHGGSGRHAGKKVSSVTGNTGRKAEVKKKEISPGCQADENDEEELPDLPPKNDSMKRVYTYLMKKRFIDRDIISFFASEGTLYESAGRHNAVFCGADAEGTIRHIHLKGTNSEGKSFRINQEHSDPAYGFGYAGKGNRLYVFEAPIDFLSFLTLYPEGWQEHSYIVLNGVSEHAMLKMLKEHTNLDTVVLCLDHDAAGIEACGRLAEILAAHGYRQVRRLQSGYKDWNEDLKARNGEKAIPAQEHPKIMECRAWTEALKEAAASIRLEYATRDAICRYYRAIYDTLKEGNDRQHLNEAFNEEGMLLTGVLVRIMEKTGMELGRQTSTAEILDNLCRRYRPHRDRGNLKTHLRNMQRAFGEMMEVFDTKDLDRKENKELLVRKCMELTMECIGAHIFVETEYEELVQRQEGREVMACSQS